MAGLQNTYAPGVHRTGDGLRVVESAIPPLNKMYPAAVEEKVTFVEAMNLIHMGTEVHVLASQRNGDLLSFDAQFRDLYGVPWEKRANASLSPDTLQRLEVERYSLELALKAAEKATAIVHADQPMSRSQTRRLAAIARELRAFVARNELVEVQTKPAKGATPASLKGEIEKLDQAIFDTARAWPTVESAKADFKAQIDSRAALPAVHIGEAVPLTVTPRELPPRITVDVSYPERYQGGHTSLDAMAVVIALNKDAIIAHGFSQIEAQYKDHLQRGGLVMAASARDAELKKLRAAKLNVERQLAELFWLDPFKVDLPETIDHRALLGVE